ncbi:MAG: ATP-binding protein, partial [archaeon]
MIRQFLDRQVELKLLNNEWSRKNSFVVVYGKRRVGKTELIKQFTKDKPALTYIFPEASKQIQINELKEAIASYFNDDVLRNVNIDDWYVLFEYLSRLIDGKICIVFDEFTYAIKSDRKIISDLQRIFDAKLKDKELMIILSGSLLGMIHEEILNETSPLYGRRTRDMLIEDLEVFYAKEFYDVDFEEFAKFYFAVGGVPQYHVIAQGYEDFDTFVESEFFNKNGYFYRELYFILSQDLRDIKVYFSILQTVAAGHTKPSDIANVIGKDTREIYPYLENLIRLKYIRKEVPVAGKGTGVYRMNDFLFDFWFNTVYKYREQIELLDDFKVSKEVLNAFFGGKFEEISKQFLIRKRPFAFTRLGRQWGKIVGAERGENIYEIDIVALDEGTKEIGFFECKWQDMSYKRALSIIDEIKVKAGYVEWNGKERREFYGVFAKKIEGKEKAIKDENVFLFDLDDFE